MASAPTLTRDDLMSLETYHRERPAFRERVLRHKTMRQVCLGAHATLYYEDRLTIQYQVQEMLRVERIFEAEAVQAELEAYVPLIPDGDNWKATFMIEYTDPQERKAALERLVGIEHALWMQVGGHARVTGIADEDMERTKEAKTSAVHFLRFQLTPAMVAAARAGAPISIGVAHPLYTYSVDPVSEAVRASLAADLVDPA
ncbi:MAG TPA: DUF3501 family protein [Gammaproteobacteria bacterium]|nr:DUF3501 family protein [Gammaproteobacteria bacterium]